MARPGPVSLKDLPPLAARRCLEIEDFCLGRIGAERLCGKKILVAFSGGVDSTALLLSLYYLAPRLNLTLAAAHLNHGLRAEAAEEAAWAAEVCAGLGLACHIGHEDVRKASQASGVGLEETGRNLRYAFLEKVRQDTASDLIALGHQLNDLAEDMLMRLVRGTGWPALAGMTAFDPNRRLCRPLLLTRKSDLEEFVRTVGLGWREDRTNQDLDSRRNRMRHLVLPELVRENPSFLKQAAGLWEQAGTDRDYWDAQVAASLAGLAPPAGPISRIDLPAAVIASAHPALRLRLYKECLERLGPGQPLMIGLKALDRAWQDKHFPVQMQFPGHKTALVSATGVLFQVAPPSQAKN